MNFKKIICVGAAIACLASPTFAKNNSSDTEGVSDLTSWGIGMFPQPDDSPEQLEVNRWSPLIKTEDAEYEYEDLSVNQLESKKDLLCINLKIFPKTKTVRDQKNRQYADKLDRDRYSHSEAFYIFNVKNRTYAVIHTKDISFGLVLLGETEILLEDAVFQPIEKNSPEETAFVMTKKIVAGMNPIGQ